MHGSFGKRRRLGGGLLMAALGVVALLAIPGIAFTHNSDRPAAGTIESFDPETGELVVDLAKGDTISGLVVRRTRIRCGGRRHHRGRHHRRRHRHRNGATTSSRRGSLDVVGSDRSPKADEDRPGHDGTPPGSSEDPGKGAVRSDRCNVDDLVPGAIVKRAEIVLTHGNAFYKVVGVVPAPTPSQDEDPSS